MIDNITIKSGVNKNGIKESFDEIILNSNMTISIVGPTGSGKTALINDIELLARGDTNTGRCILINGSEVTEELRNKIKLRPCVLITQNTKCFSDLSVEQFISIHSKSRGNFSENIVDKCLETANKFSGEKVERHMNITTLSGGQTRALLIADAIIVSDAPVLILDELENAGIYKNKVLEMIEKYKKMVIFVTHDPVIAMKTDLRLVMKEGEISKIIKRSGKEEKLSKLLNRLDTYLNTIKEKVRFGEEIDESCFELKNLLSNEEVN